LKTIITMILTPTYKMKKDLDKIFLEKKMFLFCMEWVALFWAQPC